MFDIPILLIVFNRIDTTRQVFERIKALKPARLFIAADGPRVTKTGEKEMCEEVRLFVLQSIDWPCDVTTLFRDQNIGCKYAVSGAIKWFFQIVEMGIILEDDCLPAPSFFNYCKILLEYYKNDKKIGMISGHNYFGMTNEKKEDYTFISTCGVWGWASWRRVIEGYDPDYSRLIDHEINKVKTICVSKKVSKILLKNSFSAATNKINTWDFQFCEYLIANHMYTIMPSKNQIQNIGFITQSTHTGIAPSWYKNIIYEYTDMIRIQKNVNLNKKISIKIESLFESKTENILSMILRKINKRLIRKTNEFHNIIFSFLRYLDSTYGQNKRYKYYKKKLKYLGKNVIIDTGVFFYGMEYISIDDNTHIDKNCIIIGSKPDLDLSNRYIKSKTNSFYTKAKGEVYIGKNNHISQNCMIYGYEGVSLGDNCVMSAGSKIYSLTSLDHNPYDKTEIISIVPYSGKSPTLIGSVSFSENVWIGIDVIISPGVNINKNSFVRSNSIVTTSFEENSYIAGDPAIYVRHRFEQKEKK